MRYRRVKTKCIDSISRYYDVTNSLFILVLLLTIKVLSNIAEISRANFLEFQTTDDEVWSLHRKFSTPVCQIVDPVKVFRISYSYTLVHTCRFLFRNDSNAAKKVKMKLYNGARFRGNCSIVFGLDGDLFPRSTPSLHHVAVNHSENASSTNTF
jgi:hypothetical protein